MTGYYSVPADSLAGQVHYAMARDEQLRHVLAQAHQLLQWEGWFPFGTHVDFICPLEFSKQTDLDGMPLWERVVREEDYK